MSRLLYVAPRYPWPPRRGDQLRCLETFRLLAEKHTVTALVPERPAGAPPPEPPPGVEVRFYAPGGPGERLRGLASALGAGLPLQSGLFWHADLARRLRAEVPRHELVIFELSRLAPHLGDLGEAPLVTDFKQGQHVQIRDGRQGIILAISNEGYADIVVDNARYCLLVPLDDLTIVDENAAPAAEPVQTLTTPLVTKESDTRTPTIYDFWDFQKDHTEGVTSISVSPKKEKKAKGAPRGIHQMDMAAFLNAEPDFNQNQAKPN